jgi:flagellar hook-basal body complex protein FliE
LAVYAGNGGRVAAVRWQPCPTEVRGIPAMAIAGLSGIESMLQQMRSLVQAAEKGVSDPAELSPTVSSQQSVSFADELERSLKRVSSAQNASTAQAKAFELGDPRVSLNDVMIDMQKANIGFQTAVQVRNRLVEAYQQVMSITM